MLFHWITVHNLDALDFSGDIVEDCPLGYLKLIKNRKRSYAALFARLCQWDHILYLRFS